MGYSCYYNIFICLQKQKNKWGVMRHPMVLNFINERLLDCALFYTLHIVAFALFLLLLSSHIFARTTLKDWAVTAFLFFFTLMMVSWPPGIINLYSSCSKARSKPVSPRTACLSGSLSPVLSISSPMSPLSAMSGCPRSSPTTTTTRRSK